MEAWCVAEARTGASLRATEVLKLLAWLAKDINSSNERDRVGYHVDVVAMNRICFKGDRLRPTALTKEAVAAKNVSVLPEVLLVPCHATKSIIQMFELSSTYIHTIY